MEKNKKVTSIAPSAAAHGALLATVGAAWHAIAGTPEAAGYMAIGVGAAIIGFIMEQKTKIPTLMRNLNLINYDNKIPLVYKRKKKENGFEIIFTMPEGITTKSFVQNQNAFEEYFDAAIKFTYIGTRKVLMEAITDKLKRFYEYEVIETSDIMQFPLGYSRSGIINLCLNDNSPHCLVGGTTGSGKSVCLRSIITTCILSKPRKMLKLHLCDLKLGAEFSVFKNSDYIEGYATTTAETLTLFRALKAEMYKRLQLFERSGVVNIEEYNRKNRMPYHLVIVDEFANLRTNKQAIALVDELLRMARVVGIHIILSTQRPSSETIPGTLKSNIAATICFKTKNELNSRILLDNERATALRGKGHGILQIDDDTEFQGFFIDTTDAKKLIKHTYKKLEPVPRKKGWIEIGNEK